MNIPVGQQSFLPPFPFRFPKGCLGRYQRKEKKKKKTRGRVGEEDDRLAAMTKFR